MKCDKPFDYKRFFARGVSFLGFCVFAVLVGCQPPPDEEAEAKERIENGIIAEPSPSGVVRERLDVDGEYLSVMDLEEDVLFFARELNKLKDDLVEAGMVPEELELDFARLARVLGFDGLQAMGHSSRRQDNGVFHNRSFHYFPDGVDGIFALSGRNARTLLSDELAPEKADFVVEARLFVQPLLRIGDEFAGQFGFQEEWRQAWTELQEETGVNVAAVLDKWSGRILMTGWLDENVRIEEQGIPGEGVPSIRGVVVVEGMDPFWSTFRQTIEEEAGPFEEVDGELRILLIPDMEGMREQAAEYAYAPLMVYSKEEKRIYMATSEEDLAEVRGDSPRLKTTDEYAAATEGFPEMGNVFFYMSPRVGRVANDLLEQWYAEIGNEFPVDIERFQVWLEFILPTEHPVAAISSALEDGILSVSNSRLSHKVGEYFGGLSSGPAVWILGAPMLGMGMVMEQIASPTMPDFAEQIEAGEMREMGKEDRFRSVGLGLLVYAMDFDGKLPEEAEELVEQGYVIDRSALVYGLDEEGGEIHWRYFRDADLDEPGAWILASPEPVEGEFWVMQADGDIIEIGREEFEQGLAERSED